MKDLCILAFEALTLMVASIVLAYCDSLRGSAHFVVIGLLLYASIILFVGGTVSLCITVGRLLEDKWQC